jgi:hypothetical protein
LYSILESICKFPSEMSKLVVKCLSLEDWCGSISWQAGTRLFGFVGAGATLGQLIGSLLAVAMAHLGPGNHLSNSHLKLMVMCNQQALAPPSFNSP